MVVIALLPILHMRNCSLEKFRNLPMVMQLLKARIRMTVSLTGVSVFGCNSSFYKQNSFFLTSSYLKARDCLHWFSCSILFYLLFHCAQQVGFLFSCFYSSWLQDAQCRSRHQIFRDGRRGEWHSQPDYVTWAPLAASEAGTISISVPNH